MGGSLCFWLFKFKGKGLSGILKEAGVVGHEVMWEEDPSLALSQPFW